MGGGKTFYSRKVAATRFKLLLATYGPLFLRLAPLAGNMHVLFCLNLKQTEVGWCFLKTGVNTSNLP